jgi:O-antigen ligase
MVKWVLLIIIALAPLPLGGNRPLLWPAWSFLSTSTAVIYLAWLVAGRRSLQIPFREWRWLAGATAALCAYLVFQVLPISSWFGMSQILLNNGSLLPTPSISLATGATWLMLSRWLGFATLFLLLAEICFKRSSAISVIQALYGIVVLYAVLGLLSLMVFGDTILGIEKWAYQGFATGTFVNRNSYATYLAFGVALGAAQLMGSLSLTSGKSGASADRPRGRMALLIATMGLLVGALLASGSRMGAIAAFVAAVAVAIAGWPRGQPSHRTAWAVVIALVCAFLAFLPLFGGGLLDRIGTVGDDTGSRVELYQQVISMISARPVTGFGGGSFELAFQLFHRSPPLSADVVWDKAHSSYLTLFAELGIGFGLLGIATIGLAAVPSIGLLASPEVGRRVPLSVLGVSIVGAVHSLVDFSLEIQANAYLFVAVLAAGFGYAQGVRQHFIKARKDG